GADNGIAVAYIMAILADETLPHPRLEAVITSDEEVGMQGAHALDCSNLQAKYMINLDSEEEGYLLSSCAGGLRTTCTLPLKRVKQYGKKIKINIGGLAGGHSGIDIIDNRTNANKLLGRLLFDLKKTNSFSILTMQGGFKDNVIPREANAVIFISAEGEIEEENNEVTQLLTKGYQEINKKIKNIMSIYQKELAASEPGLSYLVEDMGDEDCEPLHPVSVEKVLFMLIHIPDGIQVMSSNIKGLVESSLNLGIMNLEGDKAEFTDAVRSSFSSYKKHISNQLEYLVSFLGGEYEIRADYPAWEFKKESPLREHLKRIYKDMYDKEMIVEAIHAGLECGIIFEKMPGIDIVSIGPDTFRVHTIDERVSISSTIRVYQYLEQLIKEKIR
ncbi:MAG TPA: beta-Ala-His dipeptidase, partial [Mobilitalea sp.]|nr:beta-Ala-His dipeptidase [Mobilitalea sp.]